MARRTSARRKTRIRRNPVHRRQEVSAGSKASCEMLTDHYQDPFAHFKKSVSAFSTRCSCPCCTHHRFMAHPCFEDVSDILPYLSQLGYSTVWRSLVHPLGCCLYTFQNAILSSMASFSLFRHLCFICLCITEHGVKKHNLHGSAWRGGFLLSTSD